jgi:hypothetical protein
VGFLSVQCVVRGSMRTRSVRITGLNHKADKPKVFLTILVDLANL